MTQTTSPQPSPTPVKRLIVGTLLINLFVVILAGLWLNHGRMKDQKAAEVVTRNLSQVLEQYLVGAIEKIDLTLLSVVDEHARQIAGGGIDARALNGLLAQQQSHLPEIISLRVADASGRVRYGPGVAPDSNVNVADRDYFILARDDPQAKLQISKPVFARISKKWALVLARRLNQPDGSFAGVVYVNLALEHLSKIFYTVDLGVHGVIGLRDAELGLIVRRPEPGVLGSSIGQKVVSKKLNELIQAGKTSGTYIAHTGIDNIERTFSFRKIATPPYYIFVGLATEDYLAEWRSSAIKALELVALFVLVSLFSAWSLYRSWKQQQAAAEFLREQKDFLDTILENEPECVKVIAANGNLLQMNRAGLAMLEVDSILEAKKKGLLSFILPEHRDAFTALCKRVLDGESAVLEFPIEGKKGTRRWLDTHASPLHNAKGEVVALVGVTRDITKHKQAEEKLSLLNETLDQRVKEEVAKNREKDHLLIQQSRLAAMGEMIGNIAHQWRQPINALTLILSNIKDAYEYNELDKEYLDKTVESGQRLIQSMSSTIDDFRNFFQPNKEKQRFRPCESVDAAIKLVSHGFKNNNIEIKFEKCSETCEVTGYPNEFAQVVLNALSNAKDIIVENKIRGKVLIRIEKGTDTALISICDNGGGIPEEILPRVFDPYFTTKEKGTGIGLYMSKMIMDNMGGSISVNNVENGVHVLLCIPLA